MLNIFPELFCSLRSHNDGVTWCVSDVEGDRRMTELMERLRARGHRSWDHTSKVLRNSIMVSQCCIQSIVQYRIKITGLHILRITI